jgi:hypothetical protein
MALSVARGVFQSEEPRLLLLPKSIWFRSGGPARNGMAHRRAVDYQPRSDRQKYLQAEYNH